MNILEPNFRPDERKPGEIKSLNTLETGWKTKDNQQNLANDEKNEPASKGKFDFHSLKSRVLYTQ